MSRLLALCAVLMLSGCAVTIPVGGEHRAPLRMSAPEAIWQAVNFADLAQTVTIARRPVEYAEHGFPAHYVIGEHPSEQSVERYFAAAAVAHYAVSGWLDRMAEATGADGWRWARRAWYAATIGYSAYNVTHNATIGIEPFAGRPTDTVVITSPMSAGH